ncbi:MAG: DYRK family dual specificity protein kinase [archaeon]|nr:DYRK family dual specificity protein kinase [archaeon]
MQKSKTVQIIEKNINTFAKILQELNLPETANTFKEEFSSKSNDEYDLGKYTTLSFLTNQLNQCTGEKFCNKYSPIEKIEEVKENSVFNRVVRRMTSNKKNENNSTLKIHTNISLFSHAKNKFDKSFNKSQMKSLKKTKIPFVSAKSENLYNKVKNNNEQNEDEILPCFGCLTEEKKNDTPKVGEFKLNDNNINEIKKNLNLHSDNNSSKEENKEEKDSFIIGCSSPNIEYNTNSNEDLDIDEYTGEEDAGYDLYECLEKYFKDTCENLSSNYNYPKRAVYKSKYSDYFTKPLDFINVPNVHNEKIKMITEKKDNSKKDQSKRKYIINKKINQDTIWEKSKLSNNIQFPLSDSSEDSEHYYPVYFNNEFFDCFDLKVVVDRERTGFEESKEFKILVNSIIAGRYQVISYLGNATFSKAIECLDIKEKKLVCLKIIENNKDYLDQSLDEIKVLRFINANGNSDEKHFLKLYDYFYYKEHLFIVTELLKENLYDFFEYTKKHNLGSYFTIPKIQKITKQVLECLEYIHSLHLVHCDLKPENILIQSINETIVKVIDFGSASFTHDQLSEYIQSRSYRAPEVILGCKYDHKIDIWSLGCILAELYSGNVLFQSDSVQGLLARVIGIIGPIPDWMFEKGKTVKDLFTDELLLYMEAPLDDKSKTNEKKMHVFVPKKSNLKKRVGSNDKEFIDFIKYLLTIDPNLRPTATEALNHPWMKKKYL